MATQQKIGKCKNLMRSGRQKGDNTTARPRKVANARERHLKNAKRSCGEYFALRLEKAYARIPVPGTKVGKRERKK